MVRYLILCLTLLLVGVGQAFAQGNASFKGKVMDESLNEALPYAVVALYKDGSKVGETATDDEGEFNFSNLSPGKYDALVNYTGMPDLKVTGIDLFANKTNVRDLVYPKEMADSSGVKMDQIVVEAERPIIELADGRGGSTRTAEEIKNLPVRDIASVQTMTAGVQAKDQGEAISSRGGRSTANDAYVDGVRVTGGFGIPETEIEQIEVITSGVPAEYGDATGAITNIVTKGPSNKFMGGAQMETSQFLDAFGESRLDLSFAGPLIKTPVLDGKGEAVMEDGVAKKRALLGYRVAGTINTTRDSRPSALNSYRMTDDALARINANPLVPDPSGQGLVPATDFLTADDIQYMKYRPNVRQSNSLFTAKIDYKPNNDFYVVGGVQGTFGWGRSEDVENRLMNFNFNPTYRTSQLRSYLRFRHTVTSTIPKNVDSSSVQPAFQNLSYEIQVDYTREDARSQDDRFGDNLFAYGYVGKINRSYVPVVGAVDTVFIRNSQDSIIGFDVRQGHAGNVITFNGFEADNTYNPILAAYNNNIDQSQITSMEQLEIVNGRFIGNRSKVFGLFNNAGYTENGYGKDNNSQVRVNLKTNFELLTGQGKGKSPMRHGIQIGGVYEQRIDRSYNINPFRLWTLADQSANDHLTNATDRERPTGETFFDPFTQRYYEKYESLIRKDENGQEVPMTAFGERVREKLGLGSRDWVNVHSMNPNDLSLDMFEPTTLIQGTQAVMGYYGYDYLGNPLGTNVQFNDFFKAKDANNRYTRPIAPFAPIYVAGYIQDKFSYKDIYINAGVRIESYDANTKVLKDPFSITGMYTAAEFEKAESQYTAPQAPDYQRPSGIGDDYVVYVNNNSADASIVGYRNGEQWYNAAGSPVNDPRQLGSTFVPALRGFSSAETDPQGSNYDPDLAFRDYKPTPLVLPRLSFSFPISEMAKFYANYDVLAQRPLAGTAFASPLTYFNFRDVAAGGSFIPNANLRASRTINYEVGYEQALSKYSKFKLSLVYREERNLIQQKQYVFAYPITYTTFGNDDFATVKSFTFEYELRPKQTNVRIITNYTLQFAEGTGSSPTSSSNIAARDLKYIFPLNFDQRHTMFLNLDYHIPKGKGRINDKPIFENMGFNANFNLASGTPYTRKQNPGGLGTGFGAGVTEGSINGARMPWNFRIDMRIDKDFTIVGKGQSKDSKKKIIANVYLRATNILNTQNVLAVYPATGSPVDDGFLTMQNSPGLGLLDLYSSSYPLLYDLRMRNPFNISRPRRIFLGFRFSF